MRRTSVSEDGLDSAILLVENAQSNGSRPDLLADIYEVEDVGSDGRAIQYLLSGLWH